MDWTSRYRSPYASPIVSIKTSSEETVTVHLDLFRKRMSRHTSPLPDLAHTFRELDLSELGQNVVHVIVHFLYSGQYGSALDAYWRFNPEVYLEALRVYGAALRFRIDNLVPLAQEQCERLVEEMDILEALKVAKGVLPDLPVKDTWLSEHINGLLCKAIQTGRIHGGDMKALFEDVNPFCWTIFQLLAKQFENRDEQLAEAKEKISELERALMAKQAEETFSHLEFSRSEISGSPLTPEYATSKLKQDNLQREPSEQDNPEDKAVVDDFEHAPEAEPTPIVGLDSGKPADPECESEPVAEDPAEQEREPEPKEATVEYEWEQATVEEVPKEQ
ncbi:uncharacterized protein K452DRAFT_35530 [Aplosporella prunicola CBS 121167]|uniref:Uncharacterized protein n=1 Tax=Aplosporella prunicola CBS 121167 TaxID=1176127 RepID=A0A6A6AUB6_9PEZI|nr:uncharacterized protein K452DRAFT_35530 [Aplosporella prunicola CBS 121167]KAF2135290.1 hypothetical protein K452DRAFT_35530 [Aplosporella prunicola CBS 121167]